MIRFLYILLIVLIPLTSFSQEKWDPEGAVYVNHTYGFAWFLDNSLSWQKTIGTERHTVFRAKNDDLQLIVFVNAQRYHLDELGVDIWKQFDVFRNMYSKYITKVAASKGYDYKIISYEKTRIFGKHAIKIVSHNKPKYADKYSEPPITQYTIRTYDHGLSYSINIIISTELNDEMLKNKVYVESLFNGFKFTAN